MDTVYAALGRFVVRFRYLVVVAWVAITIVRVSALSGRRARKQEVGTRGKLTL